MTGSLMQLVAYGAQDTYLTGNPQITFFKVVYKRHTNFAMESISQTMNGTIGLGNTFSCILGRNGDLVHRIYLEMTFNQDISNAWRVGHQVIDNIEIEIGGQVVDRHYGEWMDIWTQLTHTEANWQKLNKMINGSLKDSNNSNYTKVYVPLHFWFCRNPGLALPLVALQYHEVKINIQMNNSFLVNNNGSLVTSNAQLLYCDVYVDYIYLDTDERRRFAQVSHEYLIEQVQYSNGISIAPNSSNTNKLFLNHPVKEIVWVSKDNSISRHPFDFWASQGSLLDNTTIAQIQLNGQDRFQQRDGSYFRLVQPYQHHTGGHNQQASNPSTNTPPLGGFYVYSFALNPEEHQPSGTCNFSRIDNGTLEINTGSSARVLHYYAVNYNLLRIMSGMAGVAFSN
jgi:hypothetical protein